MSRSSDLYALSVKLDLQTAAFQKGVASANKSLNSMERRFKASTRIVASFAKGLAAAFTVRAVANFVKETIHVADRIGKMSATVGLAAVEFQKLSGVAQLSGVNISLFESSMTAFVKRIGEAQNGMGPLVSGLKNMDQALLDSLTSAKDQNEAFKILSDAYEKLDTSAEKAALMNAAFGRSGIIMGNMMRDGSKGVDKLAERIEVLSEVNVKVAEEMNDDWTVFFNNFMIGAQNMALNFLHTLRTMFKSNAEFTNAELNKEWSDTFEQVKTYNDRIAKYESTPNLKSLVDPNKSMREEQLVKLRELGVEKSKQWRADQAISDITIKNNEAITQSFNRRGAAAKSSGKATTDSLKDISIAVADVEVELTEMEKMIDSATQSFASGFADAIVDAFSGAKDSFENFAKSFLANIAKMIIQAQILAMFGGQGGTLFGTLFKAEKGGVVQAFANGGVVNGPTLFPMAGGMGLMGEAGPEMIAPLKRGKDGNLGVAASPVNISIVNNTNSDIGMSESTSSDGSKMIEFVVNAVKQSMGTGGFDKTMSSNFGTRRPAF